MVDSVRAFLMVLFRAEQVFFKAYYRLIQDNSSATKFPEDSLQGIHSRYFLHICFIYAPEFLDELLIRPQRIPVKTHGNRDKENSTQPILSYQNQSEAHPHSCQILRMPDHRVDSAIHKDRCMNVALIFQALHLFS